MNAALNVEPTTALSSLNVTVPIALLIIKIWLAELVYLEIKGNTIFIVSSKQSDTQFLDTDVNRDKLIACLEEFQPINLVIKVSDREKSLDAIDDAAERMKKIFGDDIVIIK